MPYSCKYVYCMPILQQVSFEAWKSEVLLFREKDRLFRAGTTIIHVEEKKIKSLSHPIQKYIPVSKHKKLKHDTHDNKLNTSQRFM